MFSLGRCLLRMLSLWRFENGRLYSFSCPAMAFNLVIYFKITLTFIKQTQNKSLTMWWNSERRARWYLAIWTAAYISGKTDKGISFSRATLLLWSASYALSLRLLSRVWTEIKVLCYCSPSGDFFTSIFLQNIWKSISSKVNVRKFRHLCFRIFQRKNYEACLSKLFSIKLSYICLPYCKS